MEAQREDTSQMGVCGVCSGSPDRAAGHCSLAKEDIGRRPKSLH